MSISANKCNVRRYQRLSFQRVYTWRTVKNHYLEISQPFDREGTALPDQLAPQHGLVKQPPQARRIDFLKLVKEQEILFLLTQPHLVATGSTPKTKPALL